MTWTRRQFVGAGCTGAAMAALQPALGASVDEAQRSSESGAKSGAESGAKSGAESGAKSDREPAGLAAAQALLVRQLGREAAAHFHLMLLPATGSHEYELEAFGGEVHISGTDPVALCRGAYSYLREQCGAMITWSGAHLDLPSPLPSIAKTSIRCPYKHVQYLNPCTFGYTMAFWDWARWERELDWMALHGITMPLAMEGQEYVWGKVWASFGLSPAEIDAWTTGPAHRPWHWMGNINRFDGPLPRHWVETHRALQRQILDRMRALGMTPVAPAFAGFVPQGFLRVRPDAEAWTLLWLPKDFPCIPRETRTFVLHPRQEELYREIGRRFIEAYKAEYGAVSYYLADTFNELAVPVSEDRRYEDLQRFGQTVYAGIKAGDPEAVWVMQGWLFVFDPFWDQASVEALLKGVPDDRMLILDYSNDLAPGVRERYAPDPWKRNHAFFGKPWANGMAHNHGGNDNVKGNLRRMAEQPAAVLDSGEKGNLVGWAISPEGIESNEVVYELMTDMGWRSSAIDLRSWIPAYCRARYGDCPQSMQEAWELLLQSAYSAHIWQTRQAWQREPSLTPAALSVDAGPVFARATRLFLGCAGALGTVQLYRNDLIEFVTQTAGGYVDAQLVLATEAIRSKELATAKEFATGALAMLGQMDAILNLRPDRRLETWVAAAQARGATADEAAGYEENGRLLITTWGWPELSDYASRVWSGLTRDYYAARWAAWFAHQWTGEPFSLDVWQQGWLSRPYVPSRPTQVLNLFSSCRAMLAICGEAAPPVAGGTL